VRLVTDSDGVVELAAARGGLDPDVSRDGRSVLFVHPPQRSGGEGVILLAESAAGEPRPLGRGAQPRFSRDGRWIAFTRRRGDSSDVWLMRADGSARRAITDSALYDEEYPGLSPDGAWVVYTSARGARGESQLFVTRVRDRRETQLTHRGQNTRPVW
jgi:Tol biopolymer transport system component